MFVYKLILKDEFSFLRNYVFTNLPHVPFEFAELDTRIVTLCASMRFLVRVPIADMSNQLP